LFVLIILVVQFQQATIGLLREFCQSRHSSFAARHMMFVLSYSIKVLCICPCPRPSLMVILSAIVGHHPLLMAFLSAVVYCCLPCVVDGNLVYCILLLFATVGCHLLLMAIFFDKIILIEFMRLCTTI